MATTTDQRPARFMSLVWTTMGAACLLAPRTVINVSVPRDVLVKTGGADNALVVFMMRCFGSQAVVSGLLFGVATFDARA
jgi:hypothetical protein